MHRKLSDLLPTDFATTTEYAIKICKAIQKLHKDNLTATTISLDNLTLTETGTIEISSNAIAIPQDEATQALFVAHNITDLATTITDLFAKCPDSQQYDDIIQPTIKKLSERDNADQDQNPLLNNFLTDLIKLHLDNHLTSNHHYTATSFNYALEALKLYTALQQDSDPVKNELQELLKTIQEATMSTDFHQSYHRLRKIISKHTLDSKSLAPITRTFYQHFVKLRADEKAYAHSRKLETSINEDGVTKGYLTAAQMPLIVAAISAWKTTHPTINKFIVEIDASGNINILNKRTDSDAKDSKVFSVIEATDGKLYAMHQLLGAGNQGKVKMMQCLIPNADGKYPFTPVKIVHDDVDSAPQDIVDTLKFTLGNLKRNNKKYLIMKFVPGHDMYKELFAAKKQAGKSDIYTAESISIYKKLMMAIGATSEVMHLHDLKILHRDIKPENFMFESKTNTTTIIDFDSTRKIRTLTDVITGDISGTQGYLAPEADCYKIDHDKIKHSINSDLYALGMTINAIFNTHTSDDRAKLDPKVLTAINAIKNHLTNEIPQQRLALSETLYLLYEIYLHMYRNDNLPTTEDQTTLHNIAIDTLIKQTLIGFAIANDNSQYRRYRKFFTQASAILAQAQPITKDNIEMTLKNLSLH